MVALRPLYWRSTPGAACCRTGAASAKYLGVIYGHLENVMVLENERLPVLPINNPPKIVGIFMGRSILGGGYFMGHPVYAPKKRLSRNYPPYSAPNVCAKKLTPVNIFREARGVLS
jgi:hypothetical protein